MSDKLVYECKNCGKSVEADADEPQAPECCKQPMQKAEPLDVCHTSSTAEHSRFDNFDDACDDGRSGKI